MNIRKKLPSISNLKILSKLLFQRSLLSSFYFVSWNNAELLGENGISIDIYAFTIYLIH